MQISFKSFFLVVLSCIATEAFANDAPKERMIFAIFISPKLQTYDTQAWQQANQIMADYAALRQQKSHFSMELLDAGLKAAAQVRSVVNKTGANIDSWTLININPDDFGKKLLGRPYRYLKFWLAREEFSDVQWQALQDQTESLINYCENTTDDFDFSYYCNEVKKMYAVLFNNVSLQHNH